MKQKLLIIAVAALAISGCDRRPQTAVAPAPSTRPAAVVAPDTQPSGEQDVAAIEAHSTIIQPGGVSFFVMDGATTRIQDFPRARLRLSKDKDGDKYAAVLYSDDPKSAINPDYSGNSFYLEMTLDIDDPQKLSGADWQFVSDTSEQREPGDGLFLDGNRVHLQPAETGATFSNATSKTVQVRLYGQFRKFDTDQPNKSSLVRVNGEFTATIDPIK